MVKAAWCIVWPPLLPTNIHALNPSKKLRHREEARVWGNEGPSPWGSQGGWTHYDRAIKAEEIRERPAGAVAGTVEDQCEGKGGTPLFDVKQMFGYAKMRYRGLVKNENWLALLPEFVNGPRAEFCRCDTHRIAVSD